MSASRALRDPDGMLSVSASPRFIRDSGVVGWRGALFTQLCPAPAGVVDHAHDLYCLRRTLTAYRRRTQNQLTWDRVPAGAWSLWRPGDCQRSEWRGRGVRQFLFVSPAQVEEVLDGRPPAGDVERWRRPALVPIVKRLLDAMAADLAASSPGGPLVGDCLVTALCATLFEPASRAAQTGALARNVRQRVFDRIEHDLERSLTLADLATEAGLGVRQFCRAFRASTGNSPYQFVLERRIERAKRSIEAGLSLAEVALLCGFADQSQLTRLFKQRVGLTPAAYRRTL